MTIKGDIDMADKKPSYSFKLGSSSFEKFITSENTVLVDKTLLIKDLITTEDEVTLITRPRRWGKTLNMSMLGYFFGIPVDKYGNIDEQEIIKRRSIFSKMKIGQECPEIIEEHCCKYPVISVSFSEIKSLNYEGIESGVKEQIYYLCASHSYLLKSEKVSESDKEIIAPLLKRGFSTESLKNSLRILSGVMQSHFGQNAILLIDEYDSPMNYWYSKQLDSNKIDDLEAQEGMENILSLFSGIFGKALKDNPFLHQAFVTGVLRIAKANLFSGVNNLVEASILNKEYAQHFGFTEKEVSELLSYYEFDKDKASIEDVKSWYNGYNIGKVTIYNPWSIMNYLRTRELRSYWLETGSTSLIENAFVLDEFQEQIQGLIEGKSVKITADPAMVFADINSLPNAFYNLLLFSGYLTPSSVKFGEDEGYLCDVRVPNREIRILFNSFLRRWLNKKFKIETSEYHAFITNLISGDVELFVEKLRRYLEVSSSYYLSSKKTAEVFYNGFILGLISSLYTEYFVESEKESGLGRADLMIIPKPNSEFKLAFVIEFKFGSDVFDLNTSAKLALDQINAKNYASKVSEYSYVERTIKLGLAFSGKEVEALWE